MFSNGFSNVFSGEYKNVLKQNVWNSNTRKRDTSVSLLFNLILVFIALSINNDMYFVIYVINGVSFCCYTWTNTMIYDVHLTST